MEYIVVFGVIIIVTAIISWRWVVGIDYMHKNHPDYKGEDFLNWDRKDDGWDDNKVNSEGEF